MYTLYKPCRAGNVEAGLARGKEAVGLDTGDGTSWSLLGNAYLSHFFQVNYPFWEYILQLLPVWEYILHPLPLWEYTLQPLPVWEYNTSPDGLFC